MLQGCTDVKMSFRRKRMRSEPCFLATGRRCFEICIYRDNRRHRSDISMQGIPYVCRALCSCSQSRMLCLGAWRHGRKHNKEWSPQNARNGPEFTITSSQAHRAQQYHTERSKIASVEKLGVYDTQHREAKTVQDRTAQLSARQAEAATKNGRRKMQGMDLSSQSRVHNHTERSKICVC